MNFIETALALREQGYKVIPIPHGLKRPVEDDWDTFDASEADIKRWGAGRYKRGNIGVLCEHTPAVDLDIYDAQLAQEMEDWLLREFGETCVRVGQAPKRLLVFRTDRPFRKMSCAYSDGSTRHGVEILGHGQQFVAYGTHPDTGKPYEWTSLDEPTTCPMSSLPTITVEECDLILDKFEALAQDRGWVRKQRSGARELLHDEDAFEKFKPILAVSLEKVDETLGYLPNDEAEYDDYLTVGMALHHQFRGSEDGLKRWHDWASKSSKYEAEDLNRRWSSFGHGPDTATFATLIYKANETKRKEDSKAFEVALRRVDGCPSTDLLFGDVVQGLALAISTDLQKDIACKRVQDRAKELTEVRPRLEVVRKALNAAMPKVETVREVPKWCEGWVFVKRFSQFFNTETGEVLTRQAFDMSHGRFLLDESKAKKYEGKASDVALDIFDIQQVYDYVYLPGGERILQMGRSLYINRFNINSLPDERPPHHPGDFEAIKTMLDHIALLFPDPEEQAMVLDWIAYNVQFPSEKINWGVVIQSIDGAGKSWFAKLFSSIMGSDNVRSVPGEALKKSWTSWAEGRKMIVIEEIRLHGNDRFEVLDKLKPYLTNESISIERKGVDMYETLNVANYFMFTNYADALPLGRGDRRYYVLMASFQTEEQMTRFNIENPDYFSELFSILDFHSDVLRHWFNTRSISDSFKAKGHAPMTDAKEVMRESAFSSDDDDGLSIDEFINQGDPELSDELLSSKKLRDETALGTFPPREYGQMLARAGFVKVGKYRLGGAGSDLVTYYTRKFAPFAKVARREYLNVIREMLDDGFD